MMKTILPNRTLASAAICLTTWLAVTGPGWGQTGASIEPPKSSELVRESARSLATETSFQAEFRHRVELLDQEMVGKGVYRQLNHRGLRKHRLEITLRVGEESSSVQQASNGRFLWIRRDFPGRRSVTRLDLREARKALRAKAPSDDVYAPSPFMGLDGLPSTLEGIVDRFEFAAPRETTIGQQSGWLIEGRLRSETLKRLAPGFSIDDPHLDRLPPHVPSHIVIILSRSPDWPLFPYRIEYRRAQESYFDSMANTKSCVTMEFFNVVRQARFDAREFEFPDDVEVDADITSKFIERVTAKR